MNHFPTDLATWVCDTLRAAKDKPTQDERAIDANGNQIMRTDADELVLDDEAWLQSLHSLQGRPLPNHVSVKTLSKWEARSTLAPAEIDPSDDKSWQHRLHFLQGRQLDRSGPGLPFNRGEQAALELVEPSGVTDGDDLYLDDAAWTAHLHSFHGRELPDESVYRARERAFDASRPNRTATVRL